MNKKLLIQGSSVLLLVGVLGTLALSNGGKKSNNDKAEATVAIVNLAENSGGTGVILDSGVESHILTNSHVCNVVKNGGLVVTDDGKKHVVVSYKQSNVHDMCLITVAGSLGTNTPVAATPSSLYSEAIISGHPSLLPTVITSGHFSNHTIGTVVIGFRECTKADLSTPAAVYCVSMGGIPIIRSYDMQTVSATVKPGSSGSAVYNNNGEIAGLVFAGSRELDYAMIVPHEYIVQFLQLEVKTLPAQYPNMIVDEGKIMARAKKVCETTSVWFKELCKLLSHSTLYVN
jgi:S1-C subfamily serine protease